VVLFARVEGGLVRAPHCCVFTSSYGCESTIEPSHLPLRSAPPPTPRHSLPLFFTARDSSIVLLRQVSHSSDSGRTWAYLSTPVRSKVGMWEPFFFAVGRGVQIAYSQELTNGGLQSIVWQLSRDRGASWEAPVTISDGREHASRDGMPGLARLPNNTIVLVFEGFWAHGPGHFRHVPLLHTQASKVIF
jgi:hypothetical protein